MLGLIKGSRIHLIGVGGIGMSALAEMFLHKKFHVSGSDMTQNENTARLESLGMTFYKTHAAENVKEADLIIYSSAIRETNPERIAAGEFNIPLVHRGKALASLHNDAFGIAISGSHGKTTTTSIVLSLMNNLKLSPTGIVGGIVKEFRSNALVGTSKYFVAEADESDGSFLHFKPKVAVVTNIDSDHLDHYQTLDKIKKSFKDFTELVDQDGVFIFNGMDENSDVLETSSIESLSFGINTSSDYKVQGIKSNENGSEFEVCYKKETYKAKISLTGEHNILNSIAAIAAVHQVYPDLKKICNTLESFGGAGRRFDIIYNSNNLVVVDDYAHHPTEINATISSFRERYKDRKLKIFFEPHRYSRTKDFWSEFAVAFNISEDVYISDIYSAGEEEIKGITSTKLIETINLKSGNAKLLESFEDIMDHLVESKDVKTAILAIGAGPISSNIRKQVEIWNSKI